MTFSSLFSLLDLHASCTKINKHTHTHTQVVTTWISLSYFILIFGLVPSSVLDWVNEQRLDSLWMAGSWVFSLPWQTCQPIRPTSLIGFNHLCCPLLKPRELRVWMHPWYPEASISQPVNSALSASTWAGSSDPEKESVLYSNRAACHLKDGNCIDCIKDCTSWAGRADFGLLGAQGGRLGFSGPTKLPLRQILGNVTKCQQVTENRKLSLVLVAPDLCPCGPWLVSLEPQLCCWKE